MKASWIIAILAVAGIASAACAAPAAPPSKPLTKLRFVAGVPNWDPGIANYYAIPRYLGYFEREGLDVSADVIEGGGAAGTQLVATGGADVGSVVPDPMANTIVQGADPGLIFFYNITRSYIFGGPLVKEDSPIRTYADLKGKKVGVFSLSPSSTFFPKAVLREQGLDPERDVSYIAVGIGAQAANALQSGQVDATYHTDIASALILTTGYKFRFLPTPPLAGNLFASGLVTRRDYLAREREALVGFGRAIAKATVFMQENPEASVKILYKVIPPARPSGVSDEQAEDDGGNRYSTIRPQVELATARSAGRTGAPGRSRDGPGRHRTTPDHCI